MKNIKVAITGGIGSGKSSVLKAVSELGYKTISCDQITTDLYQKRKVLRLLKKLFPSAVTGFIRLKLNRAELAKHAFSSDTGYAKLTNAITPLIIKEVERRALKMDGTIFVEVPLLFECNYQDSFDKVIVVTRNKATRIQSVMERSNLLEDQVIERMNRQVDYDSLDLNDYIVINNDGDIESLKIAVLNSIKD